MWSNLGFSHIWENVVIYTLIIIILTIGVALKLSNTVYQKVKLDYRDP